MKQNLSMLLRAIVVGAAVVFSFAACHGDEPDNSGKNSSGKSAYDSSVSTIENVPSVSDDKIMESVISSYKGMVTLVDIWQTWCPHCITSNEELEPLKDDRFKDVAFVYIASESSNKEEWGKMIAGIRGVHYYLTTSQMSAVLKQAGSDGYPTFVIAGRDGKIIKTYVGFHKDEMYPTLDEALK